MGEFPGGCGMQTHFWSEADKKTWYTKMNHRESRVNFAEEKQEVNYETGIVEVFK